MMNAMSAPTTALPIPIPAAAPEDIVLSFLVGPGVGDGDLEDEGDVDEGDIDFVAGGKVILWEVDVGELGLDGETVFDDTIGLVMVMEEGIEEEGEGETVGVSVIVVGISYTIVV